MVFLGLITAAAGILLLGYFLYGSFLSGRLRLNPDIKTPARIMKDNVDFVPAGKFYLLGQHFSAISAAGPIVGPILAGMWFGWFPALLWIIFGSIFIGGVHDMFTLVASVRHHGRSIAEVIKEHKSKKAFITFLLFLWVSLIYIITAFTDITAGAFVDPARGSAVASSSMMYLLIAVVMGIILKKFKPPLSVITLLFLPLVFLCVYLGPVFPLRILPFPGMDVRMSWDILLLFYCFVAAVIPVWLLLQPRGYLGGFFLAFSVGISLIGVIIGGLSRHYVIAYPFFMGWFNPQGMPLLPLLFTTIACGACSGFHAIVSSGTTSKQLSKETDARIIGYGGMLMEAFVAIIALATLLLLSRQEAAGLKSPDQIYANGIATFLSSLGINKELALNFALLAFATFVYDTLDVATRLGRYIFQELTGYKGRFSIFISAFATLILPVLFVTTRTADAQGKLIPAWQLFWTIFGSSNQLLAAMTLFGLSVWLLRRGKNFLITLIPAAFMGIIAVFSLLLVLKPPILKMLADGKITPDPIVITGITLLLLGVVFIAEAIVIFVKGKPK